MKKVLTVLALIAIATSFAFAAEGTGSSSAAAVVDVAPATLEVTLDLSGTNFDEYFEIGFTSTAVTYKGTGAIPEVEAIKTLPLDDATGSLNGDIKNKDNSAHIYWIVKSSSAVDIKLKAGAPMKASSQESYIQWEAAAGGVTSTSGTPEEKTTEGSEVVVKEITDKNTVVAGSVPLTVSTVNLLTTSTEDDTYSGTLTLSIATH